MGLGDGGDGGDGGMGEEVGFGGGLVTGGIRCLSGTPFCWWGVS